MKALQFILLSSCAYLVIMGLYGWYSNDKKQDNDKVSEK